LRELNRIRDHGLWNGAVNVSEAGSSYVCTVNASRDALVQYVGVAGAVPDYHLALQTSVLVGTEVSTLSMDLTQSRFLVSNRRNNLYRPDGVHHTTPDNVAQPLFAC
jgi:hypothetical protein